MYITNITEAKASLSKLIAQVESGEEVIIGKAGKPVARLTPFDASTEDRRLGCGLWKGKIHMSDDFDEFDEEIETMFYGDDS